MVLLDSDDVEDADELLDSEGTELVESFESVQEDRFGLSVAENVFLEMQVSEVLDDEV